MEKKLGTWLGDQLRQKREAAGLLQEQLARAARDCGLPWRQSTVAQLESGQRRVSLPEFLLLPLAFERCGIELVLADLFVDTGDGDDWIELTPESKARPHVLARLLRGNVGEAKLLHDVDLPSSQSDVETVKAFAGTVQAYRDRLWPKGRLVDVAAALRSANDQPERKAARALGIPPEDLAVIAYRLWGASLSAERDRRVAERLPTGSEPRSLQAVRGLVTRELIATLADQVS